MPVKPTDFFSEQEQKAILEAIAEAEKQTSGEIRVHLDSTCGPDAYTQAVKVFHRIGMTKTRERNGILFYLAVESKRFALVGDKGIHDKVGDDFWSSVSQEMEISFREGKFAEGLCRAILKAGDQLKTFFPVAHDDQNELSDSISTD